MTTVAEKFIAELKAGKISEAIEVIKSGLQESQNTLFEQKRQEILESYGFVVSEKKSMKEEEDDNDSEDSDEENDDDDTGSSKED